MRIGCPKEIWQGERRVALTPDSTARLIKLGFGVSVESGAGANSGFDNSSYREAGAEIIADTRALWEASDIIIKVRQPSHHPTLALDEAELLKSGQTLISFFWPAQNKELLERLAACGVNVLGMDAVPRISRAQKLDALSSMANVAGYRAVIEAAHHFDRFFSGQITAAGKLPPAKFLVIGAGVAGLSAIGTARSLGAIVRAFDTRPEVKEQIQSMGAEFLELDFHGEEEKTGKGGYAAQMSQSFLEAELALFAKEAKEADVIVTTALIPGKPAPKLITADMMKSMKPGSVIVDLASEQGGNCELTKPGKLSRAHSVTLIGYTDLPSRLASQASQLYATNVRHLLDELSPERDGNIALNMEDEVIRSVVMATQGKVTWPAPPVAVSKQEKKLAAPAPAATTSTAAATVAKRCCQGALKILAGGVATALLLLLGQVAPPSFMQHFTVFVLACFVGYMIIWNVSPSLHTPLMSVTNAISSIVIIGALIQISSGGALTAILASIAILITSVNIFGGFSVTQRMLQMFRK